VFVALGTIYVGSEILLGEHSLWTKGILRVTFHGFGLTRKKKCLDIVSLILSISEYSA
jgi:hypothetical protein